ncbi:hypothetical protein Tco_0952537 [Tanacetum coccineum]|uniref:Hybrid signal transduction histidine kinase M n=1 Tax=Tanacetum coccineum TaxID=301880 RepID=A0ABQ5DY21_9ASTR
MAVTDDNTPPPTMNNEKAFGVTNIKTHVPLILDIDQLNYNAWSELFTTHCNSFGVLGFLDGTITSTNTTATEWNRLDSLVKVWIYGMISTSLLQTVLKKNVTTKDVWKSLKELFHDNKYARAMELRSLELGNLTISEYFKKIKMVSDLLSNIESPVDENSLVMHAINGLSESPSSSTILMATGPNPSKDELGQINQIHLGTLLAGTEPGYNWTSLIHRAQQRAPTLCPGVTQQSQPTPHDLLVIRIIGPTASFSDVKALSIFIHSYHPPYLLQQLYFSPITLRGIGDLLIPDMTGQRRLAICSSRVAWSDKLFALSLAGGMFLIWSSNHTMVGWLGW